MTTSKRNEFKEEIKRKRESPMDKATSEFEKALKEKNNYMKELKKNGYKEVRGRNIRETER